MVKRWFCFCQKLAFIMSHFVGLQTFFKGTCDQPCDKGTGGTSKTHEFLGKFQTAFPSLPTPVILDIWIPYTKESRPLHLISRKSHRKLFQFHAQNGPKSAMNFWIENNPLPLEHFRKFMRFRDATRPKGRKHHVTNTFLSPGRDRRDRALCSLSTRMAFPIWENKIGKIWEIFSDKRTKLIYFSFYNSSLPLTNIVFVRFVSCTQN